MGETIYKGKISFVNYEKNYASIDYIQKEKPKTINFATDGKEKTAGLSISKPHKYRVGDEVTFEITLTPRGDRYNAANVRFLYNTELEKLINRAATHNSFTGYIKLVEEVYYIKEIESYLFFPLQLSKWEKLPADELVTFRFTNLDKRNNIATELVNSEFIPEYKTAQRHWKNKTPIEATIVNISPYAIYLNVIGEKIQAKIALNEKNNVKADDLKVGYKLMVVITFLSKTKIVVERHS